MSTMTIPRWYSDPLTSHGVRAVQRKLLLTVTGTADTAFRMALAGWQASKGLPRTGEVDEVTAAALGESEEYALPPEWWTSNLGEDPAAVGRFLDLKGVSRDWLLRLQGTNGIRPTGLVDAATAWVLEREL